jgi:hypothetical protein
LKLGCAHAAERLPARLALGHAERVAEPHPAQQVARRIAHGEAVEVVRLESMTAKPVEWRLSEERQAPQRGLARARVLSDIEPRAVLGDEECVDGPVAPIALVPRRVRGTAARREAAAPRAVLPGAQGLAGDSGQVEDRHHAIRDVNFWQRAIDDAAQPYRRARALRRLVRTEREYLRQRSLQARHEADPLAVGVGPQQGHGLGGSFGRTQRLEEGRLERVEKPFARGGALRLLEVVTLASLARSRAASFTARV